MWLCNNTYVLNVEHFQELDEGLAELLDSQLPIDDNVSSDPQLPTGNLMGQDTNTAANR